MRWRWHLEGAGFCNFYVVDSVGGLRLQWRGQVLLGVRLDPACVVGGYVYVGYRAVKRECGGMKIR